MKNLLQGFLLLALVVFLASCTNVTELKVNYLTPGQDGIAMAAGASFKVVSSDNALSKQVKEGVEQSFADIAKKNVELAAQRAKNSGKNVDEAIAAATAEQLEINNETPDYWMFVTVDNEHRVDEPENVKYNAKWVKTKQENGSVGEEQLAHKPGAVTDSTAAVARISIYSRHGLLPIHEMDVACWNAGDQEKFYEDVVRRVIARINDGLQKMDRTIATCVPSSVAGSQLAKAICKNDAAMIQQSMTKLKLKSLDDFLAQVQELSAKHNTKALAAMSTEMGNYFLAVLDFERNNLDTRSLRKSHRCYLAMLENTQDEGLYQACADSLARVEKKLALLDSVKK